MSHGNSLGDERSWLAAIAAQADGAIVGKTLDGTITCWNAGAERLSGYRAEEMLGRHIGVLAPPDRKDEVELILARVALGERLERYETIRRTKDGLRITVWIAVAPLYDDSGTIPGASSIARDVTAIGGRVAHLEARVAELRAAFAGTASEIDGGHDDRPGVAGRDGAAAPRRGRPGPGRPRAGPPGSHYCGCGS